MQNAKNIDADEITKKKENEHEFINSNNSKEKNVLTVELSEDEKIVFSKLGINPLIKYGKEYLTGNYLVHLEDQTGKEKENILKTHKESKGKKDNTKKQSKIASKSHIQVEVKENDNVENNSNNKLPTIDNENQEFELKDKEMDFGNTDDMNNTRKKRRRSSAGVE